MSLDTVQCPSDKQGHPQLDQFARSPVQPDLKSESALGNNS